MTTREGVIARALRRWEEEDRRRQETDYEADCWLARVFCGVLVLAVALSMTKGWLW